MKKKEFLKLFSVITLMSTLVIPTISVYADSQNTQEEVSSDNLNSDIVGNLPEDNNYEIQSRVLGPVAVFVGGLFVGWIVDGVVVYATGIGVSQHISNGMIAAQQWYFRNRFGTNYSSVHVVNGAVFGGGSRPF